MRGTPAPGDTADTHACSKGGSRHLPCRRRRVSRLRGAPAAAPEEKGERASRAEGLQFERAAASAAHTSPLRPAGCPVSRAAGGHGNAPGYHRTGSRTCGTLPSSCASSSPQIMDSHAAKPTPRTLLMNQHKLRHVTAGREPEAGGQSPNLLPGGGSRGRGCPCGRLRPAPPRLPQGPPRGRRPRMPAASLRFTTARSWTVSEIYYQGEKGLQQSHPRGIVRWPCAAV